MADIGRIRATKAAASNSAPRLRAFARLLMRFVGQNVHAQIHALAQPH
jgi:hypothetical protein